MKAENNGSVAHLTRETIVYEDGPECPVCGRPRDWRKNDQGQTICGTGNDCGRAMEPDVPCWTCRDETKEPKMTTTVVEQVISEVREAVERIKNDQPQRFPEAASPGDFWRQGDVYITLLAGVSKKSAKQAKVTLQLVPGPDTTGSRHCLDSADGVTEYRMPDANALQGPVLVLTEERTVEHPVHGNVVLPPNKGKTCYGINFQRDLDDEELRMRRAAD